MQTTTTPPQRTRNVHCFDGPELDAYFARARAGEFEIMTMIIGPKRAEYTLTLLYPKAQQELWK